MNLTRRSAWLSVIVPVSFLAATPVAKAGAVYNANDMFVANELGAETNPFGPFSVGHFDEATLGDFTPFMATEHFDAWYGASDIQGFFIPNGTSVPAALVNTDTVNSATTSFGAALGPSQILLHPGGIGNAFSPPFHNAILRFTAPIAGTYLIDGDWESLDVGPTTNLILHNGTTLFSSTADDSTFNLVRLLNAGDTIDFVVNDDNDAINSDSTGLRAVLTTTSIPEPSSVLLLGLISLGALSTRFAQRGNMHRRGP